MLPNLVIIGAQKSATSFVQACIAAHPNAYVVRPEVSFFEDPEFDVANAGQLERLLPRSAPSPRVFGIKRPDYLARPEVAARLAAHLPDAKLIAVLRDPVRRAVSAYYHYVRYGYLPLLPLNEGLRRVLATPPGDGSTFSPESALLEYGCYATCLHRYQRFFPAERINVLLHDDLLADPERILEQLLEFLELPAATASFPLSRATNPGVYSRPRLCYLRAVQRLVCHVDPPRNRWWIGYGYPGLAVFFLARQIDKRLLSPFCARRPEPLAADLRHRLASYYEREIADLEEMLGRNLDVWRGDAP